MLAKWCSLTIQRECFPSSYTVLLVSEYLQSATSSFKIQGSLPSEHTSTVVFVSYIHSKMEYYDPSRQICILNTDYPPTIYEH